MVSVCPEQPGDAPRPQLSPAGGARLRLGPGLRTWSGDAVGDSPTPSEAPLGLHREPALLLPS